MGEIRNATKILVGKPEGKRPLGKPRRKWEDNVTMDLRETGREVADLCIWRRTGTSGELLCAR
jgi:hypothetical protein